MAMYCALGDDYLSAYDSTVAIESTEAGALPKAGGAS
jgi:hypothetical protein